MGREDGNVVRGSEGVGEYSEERRGGIVDSDGDRDRRQ